MNALACAIDPTNAIALANAPIALSRRATRIAASNSVFMAEEVGFELTETCASHASVERGDGRVLCNGSPRIRSRSKDSSLHRKLLSAAVDLATTSVHILKIQHPQAQVNTVRGSTIRYVSVNIGSTENANWRGQVSQNASVAPSVQVWENAQIREAAIVGENCVIGRSAYIGTGVIIGNNCKIQNHSLIYEPAHIADGVFIGPNVTLTNDRNPRAINPDGTLKAASDWVPVGVTVMRGASIGAHSVCVAPLTIGEWAMIGAGSTVVHDVPNFALVVGNPARQIGWVSKSGFQMYQASTGIWICPSTGHQYILEPGGMKEFAQ